jgi:putative ABC transport system substrate-binding protein
MRRVLGLALVLAFAATVPAGAQPPDKVWRVAWLSPAVPRSAAHYQALEQRLRELGYVEGRNLVIDFRTAEGKFERLPELAAELVGRQPHVLVAQATPGALAAKNATRTIPIVIAAIADPVAVGIVTNMARPGGNITGVSLLNVELSGKALQLLKEAVPSLSRPAVLLNEQNPSHAEIMKATRAAAATLGVTLQPLDVRKPDDLPRAFDAITRQRADGLLVLPDPVSLAHRKPIVDFATSRRLPAMHPFREMVDEGGLLCYGPNLRANLRTAADYVDRILKGARPGDLPIAQATKFDLVVNLKTAKALGLTIPQAILVRADGVVR